MLESAVLIKSSLLPQRQIWRGSGNTNSSFSFNCWKCFFKIIFVLILSLQITLCCLLYEKCYTNKNGWIGWLIDWYLMHWMFFSNLFFMKTAKDFQDGHIWFSVINRPPCSTFTRVQRVSCCFSLLLCTMLTSIMFWGIPTDPSEQTMDLGKKQILDNKTV